VTAIDLSSYFGLGAISLLTLNILVGLLLATKYNPVRRWPHRRIDTVTLHNWTAYAALVLSLVHPVLILLSPTARFRVVDVAFPLNAPRQPAILTLGALALYLLVATVATSYFRFQIGRRLWKPLHYGTYLLFATYALHGLLTDPTLKDAPIDYLDGEKVYVELCVLVVIAAIAWRVRWQFRQPPPRQHLTSRRRRAERASPS
jgi:predicted ferric reductase